MAGARFGGEVRVEADAWWCQPQKEAKGVRGTHVRKSGADLISQVQGQTGQKSTVCLSSVCCPDLLLAEKARALDVINALSDMKWWNEEGMLLARRDDSSTASLPRL
ncbi:hypothetical protein R1flu_012809 [Riccia fluitans]|uniref:Uncharacterized protein n=1 Tax=Riccia fluitans TaxID=41844 RepID=A0ABD1ZBM7_9MARC